MKFVKRVSIFFIMPMAMFSLGFATDMMLQDFFYPGRNNTVKNNEVVAEYKETEDLSDSLVPPLPVSLSAEPLINADTSYIIQEYDESTGLVEENIETIPDKYIGLSRDMLIEEIAGYNLSPSLSDMERGFEGSEVISFSQNKVVLRKTYSNEEEILSEGYYLINENHYVAVYYEDLQTLYMNTSILTESLPYDLQLEIINIKYIEEEAELYDFLESYSS